MGRLLFAGFSLVVGCVITVLLILSAKDTSYPPAVGLALALLIGGTLTCASAGIPVYVWWMERQERLHGDRGEKSCVTVRRNRDIASL